MGQTARQIIFHGRVQGVGFRYTASRIAAMHGLTGYVRNLSDGTVEALMQGDASTIEKCVEEIKDYFERYIRQIDQTEAPFNPRYTEFEITY